MTADTLRRRFLRKDRLEALMRRLDQQIDEGVRAYSDERGYRMRLRREAVRREIGA